MKSMTSFKERASKWPDKWGEEAREHVHESTIDLIFCQRKDRGRVMEDLRLTLEAMEKDMVEGNENE
jgi:hypothetical protein